MSLTFNFEAQLYKERFHNTSKFYWEMQSKHKIHNTDWWISMDIPLAIPHSKELLPNLFLQERSLVKSCKKVGGLGREMKWMDRTKKQTNKNIDQACSMFFLKMLNFVSSMLKPTWRHFCSRKKSITVSLEFNFICIQFRTIWVLFV